MEKSPFKPYEKTLLDLLPESEKCTFLVGAGISMDAPAELPSAREFVRVLMELCTPPEEIEHLLSLKSLRYEMMVEKIKNAFDTNLHFLDYLDLIVEPNCNHLFLANTIATGHHYVVTTNFDYLIECGLTRILPPEKCESIVSVITKEDFIKNHRPLDLIKSGNYPIFKIHGSKRNFITGDDTSSSLITTISALGKEREIGETFSLESFKKQTMYNLVKNRTLIVMGYSGSDDFDIGPMLRGMKFLKKLIWIEHSMNDQIELFKIDTSSGIKNKEGLSQIERILLEIKKDANFDVYLIKANTGRFVREKLQTTLLRNITSSQIEAPASLKTKPTFRDWIKGEFKDITLTNIQKNHIACNIFKDLNEIESMGMRAQIGLQFAQDAKDLDAESFFLNQLGLVHSYNLNFTKALEYYEQARVIIEKSRDPIKQAIITSNIGHSYLKQNGLMEKVEVSRALEKYLLSLKLFEERKDELGKITCLNNLAEIDILQRNYKIGIEELMEAYTLVMQLGNLPYKAAILNNEGWIAIVQGMKKDALSHFIEALNIRKQLGDLVGVAKSYHDIGNYYFHDFNYSKAIENYLAAINLQREVKMEANLAETLESLGWAYYREERYDLALEKFKEAQSINIRLNNHKAQADNLLSMGQVAFIIGDLQGATEYHTSALNIYTNFGFDTGVSEVRQKLDYIKMSQEATSKKEIELTALFQLLSPITSKVENVFHKSEMLKNEARKAEQSGNYAQIGVVLIDQGILLVSQRKLSEAREKIEEGLYIFSVIGKVVEMKSIRETLTKNGIFLKPADRKLFDFDYIMRDEYTPTVNVIEWIPSVRTRKVHRDATDLIQEGYILVSNKHYREAIEKLQTALTLLAPTGEKETKQTAKEILLRATWEEELQHSTMDAMMTKLMQQLKELGELSIKSISNNDVDLLIENLEDLHFLFNLIGQKDMMTAIQNMIDTLKSKIGTTDTVVQPFIEIMSLDHPDASNFIGAAQRILELQESEGTLENYGLELEHIDDYLANIAKFQNSLTIFRNKGDIFAQIETLLILGDLYNNGKEFKSALRTLEQAFNQAVLGGNAILQARSIQSVGDCFILQSQIEKALDYYEYALRIYDELGDVDRKIKILNIIGDLYIRRRDYDVAFDYLSELLSYVEGKKEYDSIKGECLMEIGQIYEYHHEEAKAFDVYIQAQGFIEQTQSNAPKFAWFYSKEGQYEYAIGDINSALESYEGVLDMLQGENLEGIPDPKPTIKKIKARLADRKTLATDLVKAGTSYVTIQYLSEALKSFEVASEIFEKLGKHADNAAVMEQMAAIYQKTNDLKTAVQYLDEAIIQYKKCKDKLGIERVQGVISQFKEKMEDPTFIKKQIEKEAKKLLNAKDYNKAKAKFEELQLILEKIGDKAEIVQNLMQIGLIYNSQQNFDTALKYLMHSQQLSTEIDNTEIKATIYFDIGLIKENCYEYDIALKNYEDALKIAIDSGNQYIYAQCAIKIGNILKVQRKYDSALESFQSALNIFDSMKLLREKAETISNIGDIYRDQSKYTHALEKYNESLEIAKKQNDLEIQIYIMNKLANAYDDMNESRKALNLYEQGVAIAEQLKDEYGKAMCVFNAALIQSTLGELEKALVDMNIALVIAEKNKWLHFKAPILLGIGDILQDQGKVKEALDYYHQAEPLIEKIQNMNLKVNLLIRIGNSIVKLGDIESGSAQFDQAAALAEKLNYNGGKANAIVGFGDIQALRNNYNTALEKYNEALQIHEKSDNKGSMAETFSKIGDLHMKQGNLVECIKNKEESIIIYENLGMSHKVTKLQAELKAIKKD